MDKSTAVAITHWVYGRWLALSALGSGGGSWSDTVVLNYGRGWRWLWLAGGGNWLWGGLVSAVGGDWLWVRVVAATAANGDSVLVAAQFDVLPVLALGRASPDHGGGRRPPDAWRW